MEKSTIYWEETFSTDEYGDCYWLLKKDKNYPDQTIEFLPFDSEDERDDYKVEYDICLN